MTHPTDANALLMGSGAPSIKFDTVGTTVTGTLVREPEARQQRDFRTQQPETWKDGSPKMQIVVQLQTTHRDPANPTDDGTRALYIKGKHLTDAIRAAVRASGANGLHAGGTLTVTYVADGPAEAGLNPPKLYQAQYQPPALNWAGVTGPAAAAPVSPAPQQYAQTVPQQYAPAPAMPAIQAGQPLACPPGVDPGMWERLSPAQQQAVIAASAAPAY